MNRQMRENQNEEIYASASKWRSWKNFNSFQQRTIFFPSFIFNSKILEWIKRKKIDLKKSKKSKCGIWSVNNCQNNWKS